MQLQKLAGLVTVLTLFATGQVYADNAPPKKGSQQKMNADTDKDGKVSYDEYRAAKEKQTERQFKRMDTNGDGFIDASERQASKDKMHEMRDKRKQKGKDKSDESEDHD